MSIFLPPPRGGVSRPFLQACAQLASLYSGPLALGGPQSPDRAKRPEGRFLGAALFLCGHGGGLLVHFIEEATADFVGTVSRSPEGEPARRRAPASGARFSAKPPRKPQDSRSPFRLPSAATRAEATPNSTSAVLGTRRHRSPRRAGTPVLCRADEVREWRRHAAIGHWRSSVFR